MAPKKNNKPSMKNASKKAAKKKRKDCTPSTTSIGSIVKQVAKHAQSYFYRKYRGIKQTWCRMVIKTLTSVIVEEVKENGVFSLPGFARISTRDKPAMKSGTLKCFGKEFQIEARPRCKVIKITPDRSFLNQVNMSSEPEDSTASKRSKADKKKETKAKAAVETNADKSETRAKGATSSEPDCGEASRGAQQDKDADFAEAS